MTASASDRGRMRAGGRPATGATGSSNRPIVIHFEKDCPEWTCWETPGSPVEVTEVTPV